MAIPGYWGIADILGITRRCQEGNVELYQMLKVGSAPVEALKDPIRLQMLKGTFKDHDGRKSRYNKERYRFMLDAPFDISNRCCGIMKKKPAHDYYKRTGRVPMTGQMASESKLREQKWLQYGCNAFELKIPTSNPIAFWTENDVLEYIYYNHLPICSVYGDVVIDYQYDDQLEGQMSIEDFLDEDMHEHKFKTTGKERTGCVLCGFGCHMEKKPRFVELKKTHPKMYKLLDVAKNNGVTYREAIDYVNEHGDFKIKY